MARNPLRIGIDVRELQYGMGGISRYLLNILKILMDTNHEVIVFTNSSANLKTLDVEIVVIPFSRLPFLKDQIILSNAVKKANLDLFFSPYYKLPLFINCKSVITIHDLTVLRFPVLSPLFRLYFRVMINIFTKKSNIIFTVSECSKRDILNYTGTNQEKVKVIYDMASDEFRPDSDLNPKKYGLSGEYILYIGNLCPHKNVKTLFRSYALLGEEEKRKYQLVIVSKTKGIVGKIDQRVQYLELIELSKKLDILDNVHFIEFVEDGDLPGLYAQAKVLVLPSYYEGFGLPIIEAMACGCPVIASNRASMPEITGDAATLFKPDDQTELTDKLALILTNDVMRNRLKAKGLKRSEGFRYDRIKQFVVEALEGI